MATMHIEVATDEDGGLTHGMLLCFHTRSPHQHDAALQNDAMKKSGGAWTCHLSPRALRGSVDKRHSGSFSYANVAWKRRFSSTFRLYFNEGGGKKPIFPPFNLSWSWKMVKELSAPLMCRLKRMRFFFIPENFWWSSLDDIVVTLWYIDAIISS